MHGRNPQRNEMHKNDKDNAYKYGSSATGDLYVYC